MHLGQRLLTLMMLVFLGGCSSPPRLPDHALLDADELGPMALQAQAPKTKVVRVADGKAKALPTPVVQAPMVPAAAAVIPSPQAGAPTPVARVQLGPPTPPTDRPAARLAAPSAGEESSTSAPAVRPLLLPPAS